MVQVIAHKGVVSEAPENSLEAFRAVIDLGIDGFETDVHMTKDGVPVLNHGYTLDSSSDGSGCISDLTFDEISEMELRSVGHHAERAVDIASLDDCLENIKGCTVDLDLKTPLKTRTPYIDEVCNVISDSGREDVLITSFDHSMLGRIRDLLPDNPIGAIMLPTFDEIDDILDILKGCYPEDVPLDRLSPDDISPLEDISFVDEFLGVKGMKPLDLFLNAGSMLGTIYPGKTFHEVSSAIAAQTDVASYIRDLGSDPDYVVCHYLSCFLDDDLIHEIHSMGKNVIVWTVDRFDIADKLAAKGADGIITNDPIGLKNHLAQSLPISH